MSGRRLRSPIVPPRRSLGVDLSTNHAAFVQVLDGELESWAIVTSTASVVKAAFLRPPCPPCGVALIPAAPKNASAHEKSLFRLTWWAEHLPKILDRFTADHAAIEDYAFAAKHGSHQLGEVGGLLRMALWKSGRAWRKYSPGQGKLFAAHHGKAEKEAMIQAARDRWGVDWSFARPEGTKIWDSAEDLADAHSIAMLLDTERRIRTGSLSVQTLHEAEVRVFNTVSKTTGVNPLAEPFICGVQS